LATIAATGNEKYLEGFGPRMPGFDQVKFGDLDAVKKAITNETAAIMVEPIQGEGGIRVPPPGFLKALRELCDRHGLLLIFDEVQTGVGRTGKFFAYEWSGVQPDIMGVAKGIGGGFPLGICLATADAGKGMTPGTHGSTFGGNPLAMAVANAVLDVVLSPGFLEQVQAMNRFAKQRLAELKDTHKAIIAEVRGEGLLLGVKTTVPNGDFVTAAMGEGLLTVAAGENVVRLLPPLIVTEKEINEAVSKMSAACRKIEAAMSATTRGAAE
jgi:acetylornithine/N-succinyldiaminopimelate aminotransferase